MSDWEVFQAFRDIKCGHCGKTIFIDEYYRFLDQQNTCGRCMNVCACGHPGYLHSHYTNGVVVDTCAGDGNTCLCARLKASK